MTTSYHFCWLRGILNRDTPPQLICKYITDVSIPPTGMNKSVIERPCLLYVTYLICKYVADVSFHRIPSADRNFQRQERLPITFGGGLNF